MHPVDQIVTRFWLVLAICLVVFAACGGPTVSTDAIQTEDVATSNDMEATDSALDDQQHVVLKPTVIVATDDSELHILGKADDGAVLVEDNTAGQALKVGDILMAGPANGDVFGKITGIESESGVIRVLTEIPHLDEVFDEAKIRMPLVTDFSGATFSGSLADSVEIIDSPATNMNRVLRKAAESGDIAIQQSAVSISGSKTIRIPLPPGMTIFGATFQDPFHNEVTAEVKVVSGYVEVQPSGHWNTDFPDWVDIVFDTRTKVKMKLAAEIGGAFSLKDIDFDDPPFLFGEFPLGAPPVWVSLAIKGYWNLKIEVEGSVSIEWEQELETISSTGFKWIREGNNVDWILDKEVDVSATEPVIGGDFGLTVKGGPKLDLSIRPWSVVGAGVSFGIFASMKFGLPERTGLPYGLGYDLLMGFKAEVFADIGALGYSIAKIKRTLFEIEESVLSGEWSVVCTKDCSGLECGVDPVCGESCGTCGIRYTCESGACVEVACVPACGVRVCGFDPVCGTLSCGTCDDQENCNASGACVPKVPVCPAAKDCTGLECGVDPVCGESCGTCGDGYECLLGICELSICVADCTGLVCGPDPVCGQSCGTCGDGYTCETGTCIEDACVPDCGPAICGLDPVCGTLSCGTCSNGFTCQSGACVENTVYGDMVLIPAGSFWMGCNVAVDSDCSSDESPYHQVTLSGYYMDKTEVTVAAYGECVTSGACTAPSTSSSYCNWNVAGKEDHPVNCITWYQSEAYCAWAGKRLPTEAEWEKAARGTDGRKYPWGNETATCEYVVMYDGSGYGCGTDSTMPVCSKSPAGDSPYGLCDMSGNVWEWVSDWYSSSYYSSSPSSNPIGPASGSDRVGRGGSFGDYGILRASNRDAGSPSGDYGTLGARCARPQ